MRGVELDAHCMVIHRDYLFHASEVHCPGSSESRFPEALQAANDVRRDEPTTVGECRIAAEMENVRGRVRLFPLLSQSWNNT